ncbi:MAG TPA: peptidase [Candidatus Contendobacter sp.]|nr:peptidase [Candidatus Contendobacter sp.]HRZ23303.1 peptidase [Candidatus Contendobacter sp.]
MHRLLKAVVISSIAVGPFAVAPVLADYDHDRVRQLRATGQILALETIIANHRHRHPGDQLLEAELEFEQGRYVYELKMLGSDGVVREFEYNARSGELWRVERDR